ncbi:MAG: hypothetical protein ACRDNO_17050, partial [Trebonia sp.]
SGGRPAIRTYGVRAALPQPWATTALPPSWAGTDTSPIAALRDRVQAVVLAYQARLFERALDE